MGALSASCAQGASVSVNDCSVSDGHSVRPRKSKIYRRSSDLRPRHEVGQLGSTPIKPNVDGNDKGLGRSGLGNPKVSKDLISGEPNKFLSVDKYMVASGEMYTMELAEDTELSTGDKVQRKRKKKVKKRKRSPKASKYKRTVFQGDSNASNWGIPHQVILYHC